MQSHLNGNTNLPNIGRYSLIRPIGAGGMGEVFLGINRGAAGVNKQVVIKRILPHLARNSEFLHRFIDEARLVSQLSHGNIVQVYEMGKDGDTLFIAMEYVDGLDLQQLLTLSSKDLNPLPPLLAAYMTREICQGLDYAHKKADQAGVPLNLIHRDVSPSNILISREGLVKLADFGVARAKGRMFGTITGSLKGKLCYMSPEQAAGNQIDCRSDIFSLGVVLWESLTGKRLFTGDRETAILKSIKETHIPFPGSIIPQIPESLSMVTMMALARNPAERYQSAQAMDEDLTALLMGRRDEAGPEALGSYLRNKLAERSARAATDLRDTAQNGGHVGTGDRSANGGSRGRTHQSVPHGLPTPTPICSLCFDDALMSQIEQAANPMPGEHPSLPRPTHFTPIQGGYQTSTPMGGYRQSGDTGRSTNQGGDRLHHSYLQRSRVALVLALLLSLGVLAVTHIQPWRADPANHLSPADGALPHTGEAPNAVAGSSRTPTAPEDPPEIATGQSEPAPTRRVGGPDKIDTDDRSGRTTQDNISPQSRKGETPSMPPQSLKASSAAPTGINSSPRSSPATAPATTSTSTSSSSGNTTAVGADTVLGDSPAPSLDNRALPGYLNLRIWPWGMIKIGDTVHESPLIEHPMQPGKHLLQVYNENLKFSKRITVEIKSEETVTEVIQVNRTGDD